MNCEKAKEWMSESWSGELASDRRAQLELHLRSCPACTEESESLRELWHALGELPVEKPGPEVRSRFYLMLDAYRLGAQQAGRRHASILSTLIAWRPPRPVLQFAVAASLLIAGHHGRPLDVRARARTTASRAAQSGGTAYETACNAFAAATAVRH